MTLRLVFLAAGLVVFWWLCRSLGLGELREAVAGASPPVLVLFGLLSFCVFLTYALRWQVVLASMNGAGRPPLLTLLLFRASEQAVSSLLPSAHFSGEPVRALLLRRRGVDWSTSISSVVMDRILDLSASSIAGPLYAAIFFLGAGEGSSTAARWVMVVMLLCVAALGLFYYHAYRGGVLLSVLVRRGVAAPLRGSIEAIDRRLAAFVRTPSFAVGLLLSFAAEALVLAELWTLARAFHLPIGFSTLVGVMVGMGISQLLPVPAAIGSLEATEAGILKLAGGAASHGLTAGLIIRFRETIWILVGLSALYAEGFRWRSWRSSGALSPIAIVERSGADQSR